ncbi:MAG: hypothetical protein SV186_00960 [Candidatus Nanohaloarchaea archaeon]|nr:hypothetical protein [Candidatus Nanohaloarchaea archaeon]
MESGRIDVVLDSLFYLSIVLISFGAGMKFDTYLASGNYTMLLIYAVFLVLGYTQLVLGQQSPDSED